MASYTAGQGGLPPAALHPPSQGERKSGNRHARTRLCRGGRPGVSKCTNVHFRRTPQRSRPISLPDRKSRYSRLWNPGRLAPRTKSSRTAEVRPWPRMKSDPGPSSSSAPMMRGELSRLEEFADAVYKEPWRCRRMRGRLVVMTPDGGDHVETASRHGSESCTRSGTLIPKSLISLSAMPGFAWTMERTALATSASSSRAILPRKKIPDRIPDLMFEIVSPGRTSRHRDHVNKRSEYERLGVKEYVIVDRFKKQVTVHTLAPVGIKSRCSRRPTYTRVRSCRAWRSPWPRSGIHDAPEDRRRAGGRPGQRHRRRGARRLDQRRPGRRGSGRPRAKADRTIDARGYVVMPAGVDVHSHIAGAKVNAARMLRPEEQGAAAVWAAAPKGFRSGTRGSVPSTFATGYQYAGTRLHDGRRCGDSTAGGPACASPNCATRRSSTRRSSCCMGNNHAVMDQIRGGERERTARHGGLVSEGDAEATGSRWSIPVASNSGSKGRERSSSLG